MILFKMLENLWTGIVCFFVGLFSLGIAVSYPWTLWIFIPLVLLIIFVAIKDKWKKPAQTYVNSQYTSSYTSIARGKREYMYQMQRLYDAKKQELAALELKKDVMDSATYERECRHLQWQVDETKRNLEQATEEYRRAEIEAP